MLKKMDTVPVSTKTIIATSNLQFDILNIFSRFPLGVKEGDVEVKLLYYQNQTRGDESFMKKKAKKCFRNAVNVIMQVEKDKYINFKLSKNGKFQLTGCKKEEHATRCVLFFITRLFQECRDCITVDAPTTAPHVQVYFQTVMTNIDFSLGFCVDRQKLDTLLNQETPFHSLLETSFGYTGVNIKFPLTAPWWEIEVPVATMHAETGEWTMSSRSLERLGVLTGSVKKKYNTFLVFHSGNVIMSGMTKETMRDHYEKFHQMIQEWRPVIEEKIKN